MELRHLRTIEAVARHGSLTRAGEELYLSQSRDLAADPPARAGARLRRLPAHEPPRRADGRGPGDPRVRAPRPGRGRRPAHRARGDDRPAARPAAHRRRVSDWPVRRLRHARRLPGGPSRGRGAHDRGHPGRRPRGAAADELDCAFTALNPDTLGDEFAATLLWEEEFVVALPLGHRSVCAPADHLPRSSRRRTSGARLRHSTPDAGAIGEAFGDYLARDRLRALRAARPTSPASPTGTRRRTRRRRRTACGASTATSATPTSLEGEVHADGEIWSRALVGHPRRAGRQAGRHHHHPRAVRLHGGHLDAARPRRRRSPPRACTARAPRGGPGGVRRARARVARARAVAAARTAARGGEDQRDHGRQRYRPARVRTDRCPRRRRDERADARLPRLPGVRARAVAQHARGLSLRPAAARGLPRPPRRRRRRRPARRPQRLPGRAGERAARAARRWRPPRCSARPRACAPSTATCAARACSTATRPPTCARRARASACRRSSAATRSPACSSAPKGTDPAALRDRALLELMYACGLRASEAIGLDVRDVDLTLGVLRARGKGSKERLVPDRPRGGRGHARPTSSAAARRSSASATSRACSSTAAAAASRARASTRSSSATRAPSGSRTG